MLKALQLSVGRLYTCSDTINGEVVLCGGNQDKSCLELTETGGNFAWTPYATAKDARKDHVSWVSPRGLVLIGGDGNEDAELITPGEVGQILFNLSETNQRYE